jgi:hypothetical protein
MMQMVRNLTDAESCTVSLLSAIVLRLIAAARPSSIIARAESVAP